MNPSWFWSGAFAVFIDFDLLECAIPFFDVLETGVLVLLFAAWLSEFAARIFEKSTR